MKIGYFTANNIALSETFIHDLIIGLEGKSEKDQFVHIVGQKKGNSIAKNTLFTHFKLNNRLTKTVNEIEERAKLNSSLTIKLKQKWTSRMFIKLKKNGLPDVAFMDYGHTAILLDKFLVENKIPYIVHFHGYDTYSAFASSIYTHEINKVFQNASYIVVPSFHLKRLLVLQGCSPDKIHIIRIGIKVKNMQPIPWSKRIEKGPSIVFLGRLTEKKNPIALLHSFHIVKKHVPNAKLTIIGDGKLKREVLRHIDLLRLNDSVNLSGGLPQKEAYEIMRHHWVYAQHSVVSNNGDLEGCAVSPAEAAAFELPVVSTLHNGIPEYVVDGKSGFLVREFDYVTMGEKIVKLLTDTKLAENMGREGRKIISKMNDPSKRINSIFELLLSSYSRKKSN